MSSKLDLAIEQSTFLLEQQSLAREECARLFDELLKTIDHASSQNKNEVKRFEHIYDIVAGLAQKFSDDTQDDIEDIEKQLIEFKKLRSIPNIKQQNKCLILKNKKQNYKLDFNMIHYHIIAY